jgi:hypothetical protein
VRWGCRKVGAPAIDPRAKPPLVRLEHLLVKGSQVERASDSGGQPRDRRAVAWDTGRDAGKYVILEVEVGGTEGGVGREDLIGDGLVPPVVGGEAVKGYARHRRLDGIVLVITASRANEHALSLCHLSWHRGRMDLPRFRGHLPSRQRPREGVQMGRKHTHCSTDFRAEAVRLAESSGQSVRQVAMDLGISNESLRR